MKIKNMSLAWVTVKDFAQAKKFFSETLGLTVSSEVEEYGWMELKAGEDSFLLGAGQCSSQNSIKPGQNAVLTLTVDDVIAAKNDLEKKGVCFVGEIIEVPGHVKMALFQDPDGNHFQLVEQLDS